MVGKLAPNSSHFTGGGSNMSPVGAIFVPFFTFTSKKWKRFWRLLRCRHIVYLVGDGVDPRAVTVIGMIDDMDDDGTRVLLTPIRYVKRII